MKKAVILAGGKGTRLSPLTDDTPKPLMPFIGKTILERILDKLNSCGIGQILISTMHMPEKIKEKIGTSYGGSEIKYLVETVPLGTAGGISIAKKLLELKNDEPFLVISGDCVCDFDLLKAYEHHTNSGCDITVITTECDDPLEYGIVLSDKDGLIKGFNEKPSWSQVNCNRINTGIYIINASVADMIPNSEYDFAKDLFPKMLKEGKRLSEYVAQGYWCDIGSPESYYKCNIDALTGKIKGFCDTNESNVFVSTNVSLNENAKLGPNVSIEENCTIEENCSISGSILHGNVHIGKNTRVEGAIICKNATVGSGCRIEGGAIIGSGVTIADRTTVKSGSIITSGCEKSAHYDDSALFSTEKGIEITGSEMCRHLGKSIAAAIGKSGRIGVMYDSESFTRACALALFSGLENSDVHVLDFGDGFRNLAPFASVSYKTDCFIYINENENKIYASLFNRNGLSPSHDFERRLKKIYREVKNDSTEKASIIEKASVLPLYFCTVCDNLKEFASADIFKDKSISIECTQNINNECAILKKAYTMLGGNLIDAEDAFEKSDYIVSTDDNGEIYVSQSNYTFDSYHMLACLIAEENKLKNRSFALPLLCPECFDGLVGNAVSTRYPLESSKRFNFPQGMMNTNFWISDNLLLCARFLSFVLSKNKNLSELYANIPTFSYRKRTILLPEGSSKTLIIKKLSGNTDTICTADSYEGFTLRYPNGKVTVVPAKSRAFRLYSEAVSTEIADALCDETERAIREK